LITNNLPQYLREKKRIFWLKLNERHKYIFKPLCSKRAFANIKKALDSASPRRFRSKSRPKQPERKFEKPSWWDKKTEKEKAKLRKKKPIYRFIEIKEKLKYRFTEIKKKPKYRFTEIKKKPKYRFTEIKKIGSTFFKSQCC
jgi:hypothetical protein